MPVDPELARLRQEVDAPSGPISDTVANESHVVTDHIGRECDLCDRRESTARQY